MKLLPFLRRRRSPAAAPATQSFETNPADWSIVKVENDGSGESVVMRARFTRPDRGDLAALRTAIVVKWPYAGANRMPSPEINARQLDFERALDPLAPGEISELVHVSTGLGLKEWIFYATTSEAFMERFNDLLANHDAYPIEIEFYDDPEWRVWADMINPLTERADS